MAMNQYLVAVVPLSPTGLARRLQAQAASMPPAKPPTVRLVNAETPERALDTISVPPGGHAFVVKGKHARRFYRQMEPRLVETDLNGRPLPGAV